MAIKALGRLFDICHGITPVADLAAGANTGARLHLRNYKGVCVVAYMGAVSAGTDTFVPDVQEHTAKTGGTSRDLDVVTQWFIKNETTLDGDETWTRVTQAAGSEISLTGATYAATQLIVATEISSTDLSDDCEWISVDIADAGTGGTRAGCVLYIPYGLGVQRRPDLLPEPNA